MLRVASAETVMLNVLVTIDRAGSRCGATYIQNATISGKWIADSGTRTVHVQAAPAVPKKKALQVSLDDDASLWQAPADVKHPGIKSASHQLSVLAKDVKI